MMKKKIICVCIITLVTLGSLSTLLVTNKVNAENPPEEMSVMLPYDYMWFNITKNLSKVITNNLIYPTNGEYVRKGRAFGSVGDRWTADFLNKTMHNDLNLENVKKLQLGPIQKLQYIRWHYTSLLDVNDFNLTINNGDYTLPNPVPKNETFAFASKRYNNIVGTRGFHNYTYNRSFDHIRVFEKNISQKLETLGNLIDIFGGRYTGVYLNVTNCTSLTEFSEIVANVMYVPTRGDLPADQEGILFLINENESCQAIIDNVTSNASGILVIHDNSKSSYNASTENTSVCVARTKIDEQNLTDVIELLQDDIPIIADNINDNKTLTFQYDFENVSDPIKSQDHVYLVWLPTCNQTFFIDGFFKTLVFFANFQWSLNAILPNFLKGSCYGLILYNALPDTHYMEVSNKDWVGWSSSIIHVIWNELWGLQMFSVNYTVGNFIREHCNCPCGITINGHIDQQYIKEEHPIGKEWTAGVEAYNVEGNISNPHSPDDAIVILSNRYDGWYSQASGDSALGAGIVLGIAKYMKENDIQPKYNMTFLMTTGEEYGFRGAWHYSHSHPSDQYNIIRWIGLDQLGFTQEGTTFTLEALSNHNDSEGKIIWEIVNQSGYHNATGNEFEPVDSDPGFLGFHLGGTDEVAWRSRLGIHTICFDQSGNWIRHHEAGINYTEGDSMKYMDRNCSNATMRAIWDVVKYFCINPNCKFDDISYEAYNLSGGTAPDALKTTFTVKSVLPSDRVMIRARFYNTTGDEKDHQFVNITANKTGVTYNITFTLPPCVNEGDYNVTIDVG